MIALGSGFDFLTYLWHYLLARLMYDDLVRPLTRSGTAMVLLPLAIVAIVSFLLGRRSGRRRRFDRWTSRRRP